MQQLRQHYERQDSEELLDIARKELTAEARAILYRVLEQRGVSIESAELARVAALRQEQASMETERSLAPLWLRLFAFTLDVWGAIIVLFVVLLPVRFISVTAYENIAPSP
jgi:hypothetical protein